MFCRACGTYSTGGHLCPGDEHATAVATIDHPRTEAPAGWYPDALDASLVRWWDGVSWSDHTAAAMAARPPQTRSEHGQFLGAIPRTVGRKGRFDILVYERALVFAKVPGTDPAALGLLLGFFTVGGLIGYIPGDYIGAGSNDKRISELAARRPEEVAGANSRNALVPVGSVQSGNVVVRGGAGGVIDLRTTTGARFKRRWTRPHTRGKDIGSLLGRSLQHAATIKRASAVRAYAPAIALVGMVALMLLAIALPTFLGARDSVRSLGAGRQQVAATCAPYLAMVERAGEGTPPSHEELVATIDPMVAPFTAAAASDIRFAAGRDAAVEFSQLLRQPSETIDGNRVGQLAGTLAGGCSL